VTTDFYNSILFYILLLLPLIAIPIGIGIYHKTAERNKDIIGAKQRKADKLAKKYLSEAKQQLGNKEQFYIALEKALHNYLKAKFRFEISDISRDKITEILKSKEVDSSSIDDLINVLNDCDFARFTPITDVMMEEEYEKAKLVITALDKQL
jgi:protoporphyrinogen oxidase